MKKNGAQEQLTDLILYGLRTLAYGSIAASDPVSTIHLDSECCGH